MADQKIEIPRFAVEKLKEEGAVLLKDADRDHDVLIEVIDNE